MTSISSHSFTLSMREASFCSCEEWALRRPSRASALGGRGSVFGIVFECGFWGIEGPAAVAKGSLRLRMPR